MILRKCKGNNTYRLKHKQVKVVSQYTIVAYTLLSLTVHSNNTVGFYVSNHTSSNTKPQVI